MTPPKTAKDDIDTTLSALPSEPKSESEILGIIMAANEWNDGGMVLSNNARNIIRALKSAGCLYVAEQTGGK